MFRKAIVALGSMCVLMTPAVVRAATDIVLYATDGSNLHGNWARRPDPTAAAGEVLASADVGWANTGGPLAAPANFVDFSFVASSATPYHLWIRMRAASNNRNNDSVYVQFGDALTLAGAPAFAIGGTDGITVNLAGDAIGAGLNGWGWRDGAYWLAQTPSILFATAGLHTLRVQTREDGVIIDQIVLSPATYLTTPPGPAAADATIVARLSTLPSGWSAQLVGAGYAGDASFVSGTFTVTDSGANIWGTADAFEFVSRPAAGNAQVVAHVTSLQARSMYATAGVMLRESAAAGAAHVILDVRPNGAIEFMTRSVTGGQTIYVSGAVQPAPAWLRLTRIDTTITGEVSADGIAWTSVGSIVAALPPVVAGGIVVSSVDTSGIATATFDSVALTLAPNMPQALSPVDASSGVTLTPSLDWTSTSATSFDVRFGTSANPPVVASGLSVAAYVPPALQNDTKYYWQVVARNALGAASSPVWSFATMPGAPIAYNAVTDRNAYVKPPLPVLGPAGYAFADPTFGSALLRVTDAQTRPGTPNRSFRVPSNAHLSAWNKTSTMFYVVGSDGLAVPYAFDPSTMTSSRIQPAATGNGGLALSFYGEPQFSLVNATVLYGTMRGGNNRTIAKFDFQTGLYTTVINLDTLVAGLGGYVGGVMSGGVPDENLIAFFGGGSQDNHYYTLWAPLGNLAAGKVLNTLTSTINGAPVATTLNFHIHSAEIDRSGRFVLIYPTSVDLGSPRYAAKVYVWDTAVDRVTPVTSAMHPSGHDATGYGYWVNQDCCTNSTWDAGQWQLRSLTALGQTRDLIAPVQPVKEVYLADHTSWNNAQPSTLVPVISSTYRYGNNTAPVRAWDDEIIGIQTDPSGGTVWRFAHHRSIVGSDSNPASPYFWYQPIVNVSPDGRWAVFTSNWEKTLGTDAAEGTFRQDVFLVQLTPQP